MGGSRRIPWLLRGLLATLLVTLLVTHSGCAAMVRTWHFAADMTEAPAEAPLRIGNPRASVTRDVVVLEMDVMNRRDTPTLIEVGPLTLVLPDGTRIVGRPGLIAQGMQLAGDAMTLIGVRDEPDPRIAPGGIVRVEVGFRDTRRDLRRYASMVVETGSITADGKPGGLPAITLHAPPQAPIGQDI